MHLTNEHIVWASEWRASHSASANLFLAARRSWGPSGSGRRLLGGSEDPWLCVSVFRQICLLLRVCGGARIAFQCGKLRKTDRLKGVSSRNISSDQTTGCFEEKNGRSPRLCATDSVRPEAATN